MSEQDEKPKGKRGDWSDPEWRAAMLLRARERTAVPQAHTSPEFLSGALTGAVGALLLVVFIFGLLYRGEQLCSREVKEAGERAVYRE